MDWLAALDFERALKNCHNDIIGDWHRDPWGWPELDWAAAQPQDLLIPLLNGSGVRRAARLDVAKENFSIRPAIVMDPLDRLIYQALVDRLSVQLIGDRPDWIYGWRLIRAEPEPGHYARNDLNGIAIATL